MARKVNYSKKIEKIKAQLDELSVEIENGAKNEDVVVEQKIKNENNYFRRKSTWYWKR